MINKIFGVLIVIIALGLGYMVLEEDLRISPEDSPQVCAQLTPAQQLANMITDDFEELRRSGQLPSEWSNIAVVEIRMNSTLARSILGKVRPNIPINQDGKAMLELEVLDMPDDENPGVIIQASLFDRKSKNKIFEIGRTYTMNDLNKIPSEEQSSTPVAPRKKGYSTPQASPSENPTVPTATQGGQQ